MALRLSLRLVSVALAILVAAGLVAKPLLSLYSPPNPYKAFVAPARRFLHAAQAGDSAALARMNLAPAALRWAEFTRRDAPAELKNLESGIRLGTGMKNGPSTVVLFAADGVMQCDEWPLTMYFTGPADAPRIEDVKVGCHAP